MKGTLLYDGECPFCSRYVRLMRLRETVDLKLIDARTPSPALDAALAKGFCIDKGMVLELDGQHYHGDACLNILALLSSRSTAFNRLMALLFTSPKIEKVAYPVLRAGRSAALKLIGQPKLGY